MIYDRILVRFGEWTVKGRNRGKFEQQLLRQIKLSLKAYPALSYEPTYGRIYILLNGESYEDVALHLRDVFGLVSFSPVIRAEPELDSILEKALEVFRALPGEPATFKVSVKRGWKEFAYDSRQLNHFVGGHILRAVSALRVDVHNPQIELKVDVQYSGAYIYCESVPGAGGFPYGTNGKALLLLSGGIDSPVAGWLSMRKGLELEAVHFHSYPFTSEQAKQKVIALARRLSHYAGKPIKLHLVPFTEIQTALAGQKREQLMITLMRRAMLTITQELAARHDALAIVTGDSLGQVASQTLSSMNVIGKDVQLPMLRPLIMMDKQEIINIAQQIDTFDTSILPFEDCCTLFVPKSPSTNPSLQAVLRVEASIEGMSEMLHRAIEGTETLRLQEDGTDEAASGVTLEAASNDWF